MKCYKKRTIFDLFDIYDCEGCKYNKQEEDIFIGNIQISIYYAFGKCKILNDEEIDLLVYDNIKIKKFLYECMQIDNIIPLWLDDFILEDSYEILDCLLSFDLDIHILSL